MSAVDVEDFVVFVWAAGNLSDADNAPGCTKGAWDGANHDASVFMTADGGPLVEDESCTVDNDGGNIRFTSVGAFVGIADETFVRIAGYTGSELSVGGWYLIDNVTDNTFTIVDETYVDGSAGEVTIGGAADGLEDLIDSMADIVDATAFNGDYLIKGDETITATLVPVLGGTVTGPMNFIGINGTSDVWVEDGTLVEITTDTDLTGSGFGLIGIEGGITFTTFRNIDFNGVGIDKALYCIYNNTDTEGDINFYNCLMHDSESDGVFIGGSGVTLDIFRFVGCEIYDNGGWGIAGRSTGRGIPYLTQCKVYDNTGGGVKGSDIQVLTECQVYGNGDNGVEKTEANASPFAITDSTFYGNAGDGIKLIAGSTGNTISNNTCSENDGFGYNLAGLSMGAVAVFANNHSKNNDAGGSKDSGPSHCSETATLALFEIFGQGNNFSGDPDFTNVGDGTEDFRPQSTSVLIDAGAGGTGDTVGALSAEAGGGSAVWPQNIERHGD